MIIANRFIARIQQWDFFYSLNFSHLKDLVLSLQFLDVCLFDMNKHREKIVRDNFGFLGA